MMYFRLLQTRSALRNNAVLMLSLGSIGILGNTGEKEKEKGMFVCSVSSEGHKNCFFNLNSGNCRHSFIPLQGKDTNVCLTQPLSGIHKTHGCSLPSHLLKWSQGDMRRCSTTPQCVGPRVSPEDGSAAARGHAEVWRSGLRLQLSQLLAMRAHL